MSYYELKEVKLDSFWNIFKISFFIIDSDWFDIRIFPIIFFISV